MKVQTFRDFITIVSKIDCPVSPVQSDVREHVATPDGQRMIALLRDRFGSIPEEDFDPDHVETEINQLASEMANGSDWRKCLANVCNPLRVAIVGTKDFPSIATVVAVIGKSESLRRLSEALTDRPACEHPTTSQA